MSYGTTTNVLLPLSTFGDDDAPFAEWFGLNGGDDTHFFHRLVGAGQRIVWCDEAEVVESVPTTRVSWRWLLRRQFRCGNTISLCVRYLDDGWGDGSAARSAGAGASPRERHLPSWGPPAAERGSWPACRSRPTGVGRLPGLAGWRFDEYAIRHGQ